jgi:MYXO-CTERM domain-containing protein
LIACFVIMFVFACGGGGCSGCAGCGVQPIPGGFPAAAPRIANSGQIRLTSTGIGFVESNITGIVDRFVSGGLTFPIPRTVTTVPIPVLPDPTLTICPANNCFARGEIVNLDLIPTGPNQIRAVIQIIVDSRNAAGARAPIPVTGLGSINVDIDSRRGSRLFMTLETTISLNEETRAPRTGFTRIDVGAISEVAGQGIEDADINITGSGFTGTIVSFLVNLFKGTIVDQLRSQLSSALDGAFDEQFCTTAGTTGCPTGTVAVGSGPDAICRFSAGGDCAPSLLGTDGQGDLGTAFLGSVSPGTHAPIQYVLAAGGQGVAMNEGMSLYMTGGFLSYDRAFATTPGHNACVPRTERPAVPSIARVPAFQGNTIPGTATPVHLGIGVAEDYLNYAGWGMFDSGMFCLGVGTRLSQQLSTGLFSALVPTLRSLTYPEGASPISLAVRPQLPPVFRIGTTAADPLLTLTLPQAQIDFYVWSQERYVRFMTYQTDLVIELNLAVEGGQIVPTIVAIRPTNSSVMNSELLVENQTALASTLETIITMFAGMLGSSVPAIDLPSVMGFDLSVPPMGIRGIEDGGERFLGIFANLALSAPSPLVAPVETSLELSDMEINPETMGMETFDQNGRNTLWLHFGAESAAAGVDYEFSYRIDGGLWSPWTRDRRVQISDAALLLQAHHQIEARGRAVGSPTSVDMTPASQNLLIDILAPEVTLEAHESGDGVYVIAQDIVSPEDQLQMRWRVEGGEFSAWGPVFDLDFDPSILEVEVRDEAGNVGRTTPPLIRGLPNPGAASGCGCRVASNSSSSLGWLTALGVLGMVLLRRSRKVRSSRPFDVAPRVASIALAAFAAASVASGCDCGGGGMPDSGVRSDVPGMACGGMECLPASMASSTGQLCCPSSNMCTSYDLNAICMPGFTCPPGSETISATCTVTCSACVELPPLDRGILATDLDLATDGATSYLAGYSAGVPPQDSLKYGDLVFGTLAGGDASTIVWEIVDGAPSMPVTAGPSGWRRGVATPGDDVGRYTSMVRAMDGTFYIAYYDATNTALKIAIGRAGSWTTHVVDATADSGRYTSIALTASGAPAISYLRVEPAMDGRSHSAVRVAVAASAMPTATANWMTTEVSALDVPCRPEFCEGALVCLESGTCAMPAAGCSPACMSDQACISGTCTAILPDSFAEDLFPGRGLYTQLARTSTGLALVFYDRSEGNLYGASFSGTWTAPFLIDGYARSGGGDSGASASLFVDAMGDWHVAYVDGTDEAVVYSRVRAGAVVDRAIVDDGTTDGATMHMDGRHIVGDDASVVVTSSGEVRIAYQDATAHTAVVATRPSTGGAWTISVIDDMEATGFWIEQEATGATSRVATWWRRQMGRNTINGVRVHNVD